MARKAISYNGTSLQTANIIIEQIDHESIDSKTLDIQSLSSRDGGKLLNVLFKPKVIRIKGRVIDRTQALLEARLDNLRELLNRQNKHLDIEYASGTRRYTCDMAGLTMVREHYHITFAEFEAEFVVSKTPFATALDSSTAEYNTIESMATIALSYVAGGNYSPRPKIYITFTEASDAVTKVRVRNITTGDMIVIDNANGYANNDNIIIDCDNFTVTLNDVAWDYTGIFPSFNYGGNDLRISFGGIPAGGLYHYKATAKLVYYPLWL